MFLQRDPGLWHFANFIICGDGYEAVWSEKEGADGAMICVPTSGVTVNVDTGSANAHTKAKDDVIKWFRMGGHLEYETRAAQIEAMDTLYTRRLKHYADSDDDAKAIKLASPIEFDEMVEDANLSTSFDAFDNPKDPEASLMDTTTGQLVWNAIAANGTLSWDSVGELQTWVEEFWDLQKDAEKRTSRAATTDISRIVSYYTGLVTAPDPGAYETQLAVEVHGILSGFAGEIRREEGRAFFEPGELEQYLVSTWVGLSKTDRNTLLSTYKPLLINPESRPDGTGGTGTGTGTGDGTGSVSLRDQATMIQAQVAQGTLKLHEAKFQWDKQKEDWTRERNVRLDEQKRRVDRFNAAEGVAQTRIGAMNAITAAAPSVAPRGVEFIPGFGPGGPMETLSGFSGSSFTPHRVADSTIPFDPVATAKQAISELEAAGQGL
jgi:hypothetical protein